MPAKVSHRIDSAQPAAGPAARPARAARRVAAMASAGAENCHSIAADVTSQHAQSVPDSPANASDAWLRAQASDLIRHLQDWSEALDGREASLNARIALHERRERQFRIQRSELTQQLAEGQARVDQLRRQLEARVRRLAFEQHS